MTNSEIKQRLSALIEALNNLTVSGVNNATIITGCYSLITETISQLPDDEAQEANE